MIIAGVDEVGRGPLAGPVYACAVILNETIENIRDSKKLSLKQRQNFKSIIEAKAIAISYGSASVLEIENLNIHHASLLAMQRAINGLEVKPDKILVDGKFAPAANCEAIIGGDDLICEISAAAIMAKIKRDDLMLTYDSEYPNYGFAQHKGYGTKLHQQALREFGPCSIHRKSFIKKILAFCI